MNGVKDILTRRQRQVCEKVCLGWSSKEIANVLGLSPRTVDDHRDRLMEKLKVRNAVELVRLVYQIEDNPT
jgi:DNA-binding NarL/FixJ family response regulator